MAMLRHGMQLESNGDGSERRQSCRANIILSISMECPPLHDGMLMQAVARADKLHACRTHVNQWLEDRVV